MCVLGDWTQDIRLGGKCLPYPVSHLPSPCSPLPKETQDICFQRHGRPLEVKAIVCVWHASRVVRGQSGDFSPAFRGLGLECRCQAAAVSSFTCWVILPANFSFPWQFLCTCVCMCVGTFLSGALSYIWRRGFSLFCLVWLAPCSGDPIPAFVAWPLKVDHCVLAFYMGSGGLNFCLHLAWQCFPQSHLSAPSENSVGTERRATDKGAVRQSDLHRQGAGEKITPRKWFVMTASTTSLCFQKAEDTQVLHVPAKGSWPVGLRCALPRWSWGWVTCRHSYPWQYRLGPPPCW